MNVRNALFCVALMALLTGLTGFLLSGSTLRAQEDAEPDYVNRPPSHCGICHTAIYYDWRESGHSLSIDSEQFREVWDRERNNPDCMNCHSPNLGDENENLAFKGVGCASCHITVDPTSRQADDGDSYHGIIGTLSDTGDCATCHGNDHALTYIEWQASAHNGPRTVDCATCHLPHTSGLTQPSGEELCGSCHLQDAPTVNPHMHVEGGCTDCHPAPVNTSNVHMHENEANLDCISCHVVTEYDQYDRYLQRAGHTMEVTLTSCLTCHGIHEPLTPGED
jgi:predicted CXXCH cytochrome family protein